MKQCKKIAAVTSHFLIGVDSVSLQCEQRIIIKFLVKEGTQLLRL